MAADVLLESRLAGLPVRRGKVRDVYDLGERLLIVATDRISAFDWILPSGIPDKGRLLTAISVFWFERLGVPHHLLSADVAAWDFLNPADRALLTGRAMLVRKTRVVPIECVVRGYLAGSGWKDYRRTGSVCGVPLPAGLEESARLDRPVFTPATKAESGHDENIPFAEMAARIGPALAEELRARSVDVYLRGSEHARGAGLIIADTKFEWGLVPEGPILIDEVLTPDSSRFWPADQYRPGGSPPSFDKQFVRDWLERSGWDKNSPPPELPAEVIAATRAKYVEAYERLTGRKFA